MPPKGDGGGRPGDERLERGAGPGSGPDDEAETRADAPEELLPSINQGPSFTPGQTVAERFRVVRFIARGGMGEVYEAEDLELGERVALKTLRSAVSSDPRAIERLRREIHLSRQVTHRSVCRIFDMFHHRGHGPGGVEQAVIGFSMELLHGETLSERVDREGAMSPEVALPIVRQMAEGLDAAHEAGIVHRDLKSANVMLVPTEGGTRVVITDFGLARPATSDLESSLTGSASIVGTLAYMSPEQLEGSEVGPATDIYALGVVLYEMLTGSRPFKGQSALSAAVRRLQEPPPSPTLAVPSLPSECEETVVGCMARDPADRFLSGAEVVRSMEGETGMSRHGRARRPWLRPVLAVAAMAVLVGGGVEVWRWLGPEPGKSATPVAAVQGRSSVAVLGFRNLGGREEDAWLSTALAEMLSTELSAAGGMRTIPGENVARMKIDLDLPNAESFAPDTLRSIRRQIGADFVVVGSYFTEGDGDASRLRLNVRVQSTDNGASVATVAETMPQGELLRLVTRAGNQVREALGVGELSAADSDGVLASMPSGPEAARFYARGLERLRTFDALAARELLQQAVEADPDFPLAHSALADAWSELGHDAMATQEAAAAFELSNTLPREERLWVEGRFRANAGEWAAAVEIYGLLFSFYPDNLEYGLRLADAQIKAGDARSALETLASLRRLPPPASDDPRLDLTEASAATDLSDFRRQQEAASRAVAKGRSQGAGLLTARALLQQGSAVRTLGDPDSARATFEEARQIFAAAGDRGGVADCLDYVAGVLLDQGRTAEGRSMAEEALVVYEEIGDRSGSAGALLTLGDVTAFEGRPEEASELYERAHTVFAELGNRAGVGQCLNRAAILRWEAGDLETAQALYEQALYIWEELGDKSGVATSLNNIAIVLHDRGEVSRARARYEEALAISREIGEVSGVAAALNNLGEVLRQQGELEEALAAYEEALELRRAADDPSGVETATFNIGEVLRERAQPAAALERFEQSRAICRRIGDPNGEALAMSRAAQVQLDQARLAEAAASLRGALDLARRSGNPGTVASALAAKAGALLISGDAAGARAVELEALEVLGDGGDRSEIGGRHLGLAEALLAEGKALEAETHARAAERVFVELESPDRQAVAAVVGARVAIAAGRSDDAGILLARADALVGASQSRLAKLEVIVIGAPVYGALGKAESVLPQVRDAVEQSAAAGLVQLSLEGRLVLAELDMALGRATPARQQADQVRREAEELGLALLTARAGELLE